MDYESTIIARGRTADVLVWTPGTVLKLFHTWFPETAVRHEARMAHAVHAAGLPAPAAGEVIEHNGRLGLIYERVDGRSMDDEMLAYPWRLPQLTRLLAELHARIHAVSSIPELPSQRKRLVSSITTAPGLSETQRQAALEALAALPDGDRLCHGDFHFGNVLLTARGPIIVDWIDAVIGNPLADVARTVVLANGARALSQSHVVRTASAWRARIYTRRVLALEAGGAQANRLQQARAEYRAWLPIVAAARLDEGIEELAPWLLSQVAAGFRPTSQDHVESGT
ncbi:MAG: phosphotransferase [Anaerolineales bacterium]|nr:phosphotransferase [Anaerolineales bacterium]